MNVSSDKEGKYNRKRDISEMDHSLKNNTPKITQVGIVVRDGVKIENSMRTLFGMEPYRIKETCDDDARRYYGKQGDFHAHLIYYMFGDIEVEFIVPVSGKSIWQDYLDTHGEGLHHIQFAVDDCDEIARDFSNYGIEIIQEGSSVSKIPGAKWQYYDLAPVLPFILESFDGKAKAEKLKN